MMTTTKPFIVGLLMSLPFYFFELFVAVVQAFVFAMLTLAFVGTLCTHADEEHGH
jgi:F-type H+-transporting ATPase subunit a